VREDLGSSESATVGSDREALVPLEVDGHRVYLAVQRLGPDTGADEREVAARRPSIADAIDGLTAVARDIATKLSTVDATTVTVEFGCEFAVESGTFVAVLGKASAKSAFKVGLEWTKDQAP
jgi:hypothetical protein